MAHSSIQDRIKKIQARIGVRADGIIGPATLTALETLLFQEEGQARLLTVSQKGVALILSFETSSKSHYEKFLTAPNWPGGASGVTIGVGYDLGYHTLSQIRKDWAAVVPSGALERLAAVAGKKGGPAGDLVHRLTDIRIPYEAACRVFFDTTLCRFARKLDATYPGVDTLFPDAQAALLSLVFNRGCGLAGERRSEMAAIKPLVAAADYAGIAAQIRSMTRLWVGKGLDGLIRRRNEEAGLVLGADRPYEPDELIRV